MKLSLAFFLCLLLTGASSCKNTWNQEDKDNYIHTCMESLNATDGSGGKPKAYCDCMLNQLIEKYPNVNDMMEHMQDVISDPELQKCKEELK